jgi:transcriptional regulator with XRE-family HTH domain
MAQTGTRVTQQRRLRAELRRIRETAGHTQKTAAELTGWSISKLIRIETGVVKISPSDMDWLLKHYQVNDQTVKDELLAITQTKESMWWDKYLEFYPQQFFDFLDFENSAMRIQQYMGFVIPGLLQTREYATALIKGYDADPASLERGVEMRMLRQYRLTRGDRPSTSFVIDEAVLHRWIGGPEVMRNQLTRLKELALEPNISIRIVPFSVGMHPGMRGSFTVFEYSSDVDDLVVNVENPHGDVLIQDNTEAMLYLGTFHELEEFAAPEQELNKVIDPVIDTMASPPIRPGG